MPDPAVPDPAQSGLQFDAVQSVEGHVPEARAPVCVQCKQPIANQYFEVQCHVVCGPCKDAINAKLGLGGPSRLWRAALYGVGAAILGAVIYYAIREATGLEIGLIAILVGWLVGRAVQVGGGGAGGWKYQTLAVGLTYFAIASTYLPIIYRELANRRPTEITAGADSTGSTASGDAVVVPDAATDSAATAPATHKSGLARLGSVLLGVGFLIGLPIIANLYDMPSGILGLAILSFGLLQAWRMNKSRALAFTGPFQVGSGTAPGGQPS